MKQIIILLFILTSSLFAEEMSREVTPEEKPIVNLFTAVKTQNVKLLESVFSQRMIQKLSIKPGWDAALKEYTRVFEQEFGDFELKDFAFFFEETKDSKGRITILFKGKNSAALSIIKEGKEWKMDEK